MADRKLIRELQAIVGRDAVLHAPEDLLVYEYDATIERGLPEAVVLPVTTQQVSRLVKLARRRGLPVVARGAGTGLSGGAIPAAGGIMLAMTRMTRILEVDAENRLAVVEPGVVNLDLSKAVAPHGLYYAPDPSSQKACTLGGNVAENAGGPHCLAYGVTTNHILGLEVVLADGDIVWLGGKTADPPGYDLRGLVVGCEGTLAIVTKIIVRLLPLPQATITLLAIFNEVDQASRAVSAIIGQGIIPAALEMMDKVTMQAVEAAVHAGYPPDAGAVLLIEVDGLPETVGPQAQAVEVICSELGAREVRIGFSPPERERLWAGRKGALGALGRLAPSYYILDGVVPRTKLPQVLQGVYEIGERYRLRIANVFHAGDGNLHPNILFDESQPGQSEQVLAAGADILRLCVEAGGTITGEHGVGMEKRDFMRWIFSDDDLEVMSRIKVAFLAGDGFNPGKVFPTGVGCGEITSRQRAVIQALGPDVYI
ncbi:MAG: FAD-linked oxidase C-terminal domain-containing protein [Chloroflexota bacterium]|nr:FAD-linked oxidase C-terminal domain-containing protein [Chloroflexota bacterium]